MKINPSRSFDFTPVFIVFIFLTLFILNASNAFSQEWIYTVQPGDNLWNLSKKHLKSLRYWKNLAVLNNVSDPLNIPPGTTLRFPVKWLKSGSSVGKLVELTGEATVIERKSGRTVKAWKGMLLWDSDTIMTTVNSNATLQFADGSRVLVQADSELKMENLMSYGETGMAETQVRLQSGRVHNNIIPKKGPASRFEISTPSAIAAVRGTEYRISAEDNGDSKAEVLTGEVGVDSSGTLKVVPEGFGTISFNDRKPLEPVKLLAPPDLSGLPSSVIRVPFPLKLKPIKGAEHYRMQIAEDKIFSTLLFDNTFPSVNIWGPDLPDGPYFLRIHGIDEQGLEGLDSIHSFSINAHPIPPLQIKPGADAVIEEAVPAFQWSEPQDASGYRFQLSRDVQFKQLLHDESGFDTTIFTPDQEIAPGVYYWRVATVDKDNKTGPFSDPQKFRRTPPSPDMSDAKLDMEEMVFRWRKGEPGQTYKCQVSSDTDFSNILVDEEVKEPQYSLQNFTSGFYYIRIAVIDSDGYAGPFSPYQTIRVPDPPPHPLTFLVPVIFGLIIIL